ncbi:MAG: hypothetical protein CMJ19_15915 [Phycisphaeraceae bacterium]|nr:hypothetical protein [Phycisphaeraceae bacterium]
MNGGVLHTTGFISAKLKTDLFAFPENSVITGRNAYCSNALASALNLKIGESFTIRVLTMASISSEQITGMPPQLKQIRLVYQGIWQDTRAEVNFNNPQQRPYNLFINHNLLTQTLGIEDQSVNEVWIQSRDTQASLKVPDSVVWKLSQLELSEWRHQPILKSKAYFIPYHVLLACPNANKGLITFAKSLSDQTGNQLNYFFIGAFEGDLFPVKKDTLLISDTVTKQFSGRTLLTYYVTDEYRHIGFQTHRFENVSHISDRLMSSNISPHVPGLTDSDDCTHWITGMPIDLEKVDQADKDYWNRYQSKPKVYMNFEQAQNIFSPNQCTLLIFQAGTSTAAIKQQIMPILRSDPTLIRSVSVTNIQQLNLQEGVQFAPLFLGLSLFIIISGLLILWMLLKLHLQSRNQERQILNMYVGSDHQVRRFLTCEIMLAIIPGVFMGLGVGVLLCHAQLLMLMHLWNEIIGMDILNFHASWQSFAIALLSTTVSCWLLLTLSLHSPAESSRYYMAKSHPLPSIHILGSLSYFRRFGQYRVCTILLILGILGTLGVGGFGIKVRGEDGFSYAYVAQTAVPVVPSYDSPFPSGGLAIRMYQADRADCSNLLRASMPTVYGCDLEALTGDGHYLNTMEAAVDAGSLQWIIKRQVGDSITYPNGEIKLQRVMKASVFQRGILVNEQTFESIFPNVQGAQFFLIKDQKSASAYQGYLEPYGLTLQSVDAFMAEAEMIQNRYLAIFLQLGVLGFILGIASLTLMILNQLNAQKREISFMSEIGISSMDLCHLFYIENLWIYSLAMAISLILLLILSIVCAINLPMVMFGWVSLFAIGLILIYLTIKQYFRMHKETYCF